MCDEATESMLEFRSKTGRDDTLCFLLIVSREQWAIKDSELMSVVDLLL